MKKIIDFKWIENTWIYENKKRVPQSIEKNAKVYFVETQIEIDNKDHAYFVIIEGDNFSKDDLMTEYYTKFQFPYFGFNWDALLDCLRDLDWIAQKNVIVYHSHVPKLNGEDLKIYLETLIDAIAGWEQWEEHDFEVYFNIKDYVEIQQITTF